jgi:predicted metalloprotease
LIALIAAILAVAAVGGVLLFEDRRDLSTATPPQASTVGPRPTTARPTAVAPQTSVPPTTAPATSTRPPMTTAPTTTKPPTTAPQTSKTATRPSTSRPSPRPTATAKPPTTPEAVLVRNPLYAQQISPSDCAQPPRPLPTNKGADERFLKKMMTCMAGAYAGPLQAAGYTLTTPRVIIYTGTVQTPCGQGLKGYPVFYCSANQTVYSSAGSIADYGQGLRLGGYWIAFHEYGHHVQRRIGVLAAAYTRNEEQLQISRRIELQADCWMAMTGVSIRSTRMNATDRDEMTRWRQAAADKIHGKTASQLYWIERGFGTDDFGTCSTWRATKHIG